MHATKLVFLLFIFVIIMLCAYLAGDKTAYWIYRNQVSRISRKLRFRYYEKKVQQLHETDQRSWWKQVQKFLNIKPKPAYSGLDIPANKSAPNTINEFFVSVADDLEPLRPEFLDLLTDCLLYTSDAADE